MASSESRSEIAFFDLETTRPDARLPGQGIAILEFGSILVCPKTLVVMDFYSELVRPLDLSLVTNMNRPNGITAEAVANAPTFSEIADRIYDILHGRIWAGHNIEGFDIGILRKAFKEIRRPAPEPKGTVDSLPVLIKRFGYRAGDMKMATLADYFGLGRQTHRSLEDVRMNLEIIKSCATVLFLEELCGTFVDIDHVSIPDITLVIAPFSKPSNRIQIRHKDKELQIRCDGMMTRFELSSQFTDNAGRPKLSIVVDAPPNLCEVLDVCDQIAERFMDPDSYDSEWRPVVFRNRKYHCEPTVRLHLSIVAKGDNARWITDIYQKRRRSSARQLVFSRNDDYVAQLEELLYPGCLVDAYFSLHLYNYRQKAGIRLEAKKLIVHSD